MTYDEAIETQVSLAEALREIRKHGFEAHAMQDGRIVESATGETIASIDAMGAYSGADILAWLGY